MQLMKRFRIDLRTLPAQMILSSVALVLLTAAAAGLPAIWLIRNQLDHQAWAQVEQGSRASQALYAAQQNELNSLATLTAQRPTLRGLLAQEDQALMLAYLDTLQASSGLDLVLICDSEQQAVAQAGQMIASSICTTSTPAGIHVVSTGTTPQTWLLAAHPIDTEDANLNGTVIVGMELDDEFAAEMRTQTGLEHTLLLDGQSVATSLDGDLKSRRTLGPGPADTAQMGSAQGETRIIFALDGRPYYGNRFSLSLRHGLALLQPTPESQVEAEVALAGVDIVATRRSLAWTLAGSIVVVAAVSSVLGTFLARRISQPLARLTQAATTLSQGNLDSSMAIEAQVREVTLVAQALEIARIDLRRSLTELQQEKAWADHLLEAIVEGIVTLDNQDRIIFFSPGAERITGWRRDVVLNRSCNEVFRPIETVEPFTQFIPPPGQRRKITVELANGHQATLAITGAQLMRPESGDAQVALVFRDISEEEAIHRLMGHFMANVAHEFRTPLSALAASVELLLDQAPDLSAAELHELLTSLHLGILGLQTLVDNLLESASIEAGRFRVSPRPSKLGNIIAEGIRMTQPLLDKRDQRLVVELPAVIPVVRADSRRTVQVLVNLLSNASKYGPDDAEIIVGAAVGEGWVRVTVADRGPGIPPGYRSDVFRRFVYPDTTGNKAQYGAGLGLSVVKAIIEAQGGQVGVQDRPGGGSIFWFTLLVESEE
jgi:PAS domain S-box-containing protein